MQTTINQETLRGNRLSKQFPNSTNTESTTPASANTDVSAAQADRKLVDKAPAVEKTAGPQPHTPDQDLELFGRWVEKPIWVPPKDNSDELAKSMLNRFGPFASKDKCWKHVTKKHRDKFTQVRRIELPRASIRLPQGSLYVTVTERDRFHEIEEEIPSCVQKTRRQSLVPEALMRRGRQRSDLHDSGRIGRRDCEDPGRGIRVLQKPIPCSPDAPTGRQCVGRGAVHSSVFVELVS